MVVMSQEAYNRFAPELKPEGILIIEEDLVRVSNVQLRQKGLQYSGDAQC
jgi:hypothetical protein